MTDKKETTNPGTDKSKKPEKKLTGVKTAAAVAGGVVAGNLAWGLAQEGKEAIDEYMAELESEVDAGDEVVAALNETENVQLADSAAGIEAADVSDAVNDDMSFNDAFAAARADVGPGGVFEWNDNVYGTYYKEEWENLSPGETEEYWASVDAADIEIEQDLGPNNGADELYAEADTVSTENLGDVEELVVGTEDLDGDGYAESVLIDADQDGYVDMVASDVSGDGVIDTVVADTTGDGQIDFIAEDTDGDGEIDVIAADTTGDGEFDYIEEEQPDDQLADNRQDGSDPSDDADFDNDADMSEWA